MARRIIEKTHNPQCLAYDGSPFEKVLSAQILSSSTDSVIQDYALLLVACKIPLVNLSASVATGITAFQVAIGGGALPSTGLLVPDNTDVVGAPPALNTATGLCLFQGATGPVDQPVSLTGTYNSQTYPTSEPDAIFPAGVVLTLRTVVPAAAGLVRAGLVCIPVDIRKGYPGLWTWGNANVG